MQRVYFPAMREPGEGMADSSSSFMNTKMVVDPKYEFCAPHYFDFTRQETPLDAQLSDSWFQTAFGHETSRTDFHSQDKENQSKVSTPNIRARNKRSREQVLKDSLPPVHEDLPCTLAKSSSQSSITIGSSRKVDCSKEGKHDIHKIIGIPTVTKKQKLGVSTRQDTQLAEPFVSLAEKVQKFQMGVTWELRSLGNDKRPPLPPRKKKMKLTKPREPALETSHRIRPLRVKSSAELEEEILSKIPKFKARPVNKKILEGPTLTALPKKTPQMPEFEEFRLRTMERALRHTEFAGQSLPVNVQPKSLSERSCKGLKLSGQSQLDRKPQMEEVKLPHLQEHAKASDLKATTKWKVPGPRKPLARIQVISAPGYNGGNQPYLTRLASKKLTRESTIDEPEYSNKVAVKMNVQDSLGGHPVSKQGLKTSPKRSKAKVGEQVSPRRQALKRGGNGQLYTPATSKKLHFL